MKNQQLVFSLVDNFFCLVHLPKAFMLQLGGIFG